MLFIDVGRLSSSGKIPFTASELVDRVTFRCWTLARRVAMKMIAVKGSGPNALDNRKVVRKTRSNTCPVMYLSSDNNDTGNLD